MLHRLGVQGRLLLAFVGISGFAVLAASTAIYSFTQVRQVLDEVTEQRVPMALAAQDLSAGVQRIVAAAPALLTANTPEQHFEIWSQLDIEVEELDALLQLLRDQNVAADALSSLQTALHLLHSNLRLLNTLARERIMVADRKSVLLAAFLRARDDTQLILSS